VITPPQTLNTDASCINPTHPTEQGVTFKHTIIHIVGKMSVLAHRAETCRANRGMEIPGVAVEAMSEVWMVLEPGKAGKSCLTKMAAL
jgi:hypothetical protein